MSAIDAYAAKHKLTRHAAVLKLVDRGLTAPESVAEWNARAARGGVDFVALAAERDGPDSFAAATIKARDKQAREDSAKIAEKLRATNPLLKALAADTPVRRIVAMPPSAKMSDSAPVTFGPVRPGYGDRLKGGKK